MGYQSLSDIEEMTLYEYEIKMQAHNLAQVDKEFDMHLQAWLNHAVTATKEQGKNTVPVYKNFKEFYDYDKRLKETEGTKEKKLNPKLRRLAQMAARVNSGKGG